MSDTTHSLRHCGWLQLTERLNPRCRKRKLYIYWNYSPVFYSNAENGQKEVAFSSGFQVTLKVSISRRELVDMVRNWRRSSSTHRRLEKESGAALGRVDFGSGARSFSPSLMMLSGLLAPCHIASGLPTLLLRQKLPKQQLFHA